MQTNNQPIECLHFYFAILPLKKTTLLLSNDVAKDFAKFVHRDNPSG